MAPILLIQRQGGAGKRIKGVWGRGTLQPLRLSREGREKEGVSSL